MARIGFTEAMELVRAVGDKYFKNASIIDSLRGDYVIEEGGNYFTIEIKVHANRGEISPQILEDFRISREMEAERARKLNKTIT